MRNRGILKEIVLQIKFYAPVPPLVIEKNQIDIVTCNLDDVLQNYNESIKSY